MSSWSTNLPLTMKSFRELLLMALACMSVQQSAALTLPVAEDTFSTTVGNEAVIVAKSGVSTFLSVSPKQIAYIRFDVGNFAAVLPAAEVKRAWLTLHVEDVLKPGALSVHRATSEWSEIVSGKIDAPPIALPALATVPAESVAEDRFILVDVTEQVRTWLSAPVGDFGFAIAGDGTSSVRIGSKEGPAKGHHATLEIERAESTGSEEALRIVRGTVSHENGVLAITGGTGFTISQLNGPNNKDFTITFNQAFTASPTITLGVEAFDGGIPIVALSGVSAGGTNIIDLALASRAKLNFIAIGPR